jgi:hypothetical protein
VNPLKLSRAYHLIEFLERLLNSKRAKYWTISGFSENLDEDDV